MVKKKAVRVKKTEKAEKGKTEMKGLGGIVDVMKYPLVALLVINAADIFVSGAASTALTVLGAILYGYIGWSAVKKYGFGFKGAIAAGLLAFAISVLVYLGLLAVMNKSFLEAEEVNPADYGVPPEMLGTFTTIVIASSIVASAIVVAIVSVIGAVIAQKIR